MKGAPWWLLRSGVAALILACASNALGQPSAPGDGAHNNPELAEPCVPACRAGFVCSAGRCISSCNPPCPEGQSCLEGGYCEPLAPATGIYEPPPPPPKPTETFRERIHSGLAFHMGFGGSRETDAATGHARADLDTTYGANLRSDIPVAGYLLLGPWFQFAAHRADRSPKPDRDFLVDVDFYLRGRLPVELDRVALQLWAGVPVGLSLSFLGETSASNGGNPNRLSGFGVGWNIGLLAGGAVHFTKKFGMFVEGGWLRHRVGHAYEDREGDVSLVLSQTSVNLGFMFHGK